MIWAFLLALLWVGAAQAASLPLAITFQSPSAADAEWLLTSVSVSGATVADASGHGNVASVVSGPLAFGALGATFNGNQYLDSALAITSPALTVSAWFNASSLAGANPRIVANSHTDIDHKGFQLMFNAGGGTGFFDVGNGTVEGRAAWTKQLAVNTTYHYVGVYNGATVKTYINGVQVASTAFSGGAVAAGAGPHINVARNPTYGFDNFTGSISDVRIYKRGLSAAEVMALFQAGPPSAGPLTVSFNPPSPSIACEAAPGSVVSTITAAGGNGGHIIWNVTGDTGNFKLNATPSVVNVIVGPSGIAPSSCGTTSTVEVTATQ